jgi:hypothetical protein
MSPPRDPDALSFSKIVFATARRKGWPRIEERILCDKRSVATGPRFRNAKVGGYKTIQALTMK